MTKAIIKAWELRQDHGAVALNLPGMTSLDAISRHLPQGFYTTFRTYDHGKRVLGLHAHLQRLYQPAASSQIQPSLSSDELRQQLATILRTYPDEARIRVMLAMGGQVFLVVEPLKLLPPETYEQGVCVITTSLERRNPRLKSTTFISASQDARQKIAADRAFEALMVQNGFILEGVTSNFFYVEDGKLGTSRRDVLLGVTRRTVLQVARGRGLGIVYQPLNVDQIPSLEEAFLTSSSRGIVPIVRIDSVPVGEGTPGVITKQLMKAYDEYVLRAAEEV